MNDTLLTVLIEILSKTLLLFYPFQYFICSKVTFLKLVSVKLLRVANFKTRHTDMFLKQGQLSSCDTERSNTL